MRFFLFILLINIFLAAETQVICDSAGKTPEVDMVLKPLPVIELKKSELTELEGPFYHAVGGAAVKERTNIWMLYDGQFLEIQFECLDDPWVDQNFYTNNNTPIFLQEVLEVFICNGSQPQEQYLEIQINPNNAIFLAKINYRYKSDHAYSSEYIEPSSSGILHNVVKDVQNEKWTGYIKLPLQMLNYPLAASEDTFRLNIFRIISKENHSNTPQWRCNTENAIFACWNSPLGIKPQFHKPECFGFLILK